MQDNVLKKEFKESDLKRIRNLITKKTGYSTKTQIGYQKIKENYREGDKWEENGKKWTIKNGIKISDSRLGKIKTTSYVPINCPECNNPLKSPLDKKFYKLNNQCFDCQIKFETKLKIEGKYEEYEKKKIMNNFASHIEESEEYLDNLINESSDYVTESGDIENWGKSNDNQNINRQILTKLKEELKNFKINHNV